MGFSMESFPANFLLFCSTTVNICVLGGRLSTLPSILNILGISLGDVGEQKSHVWANQNSGNYDIMFP